MRKLFVVLVLLVVASGLFAGGQKEPIAEQTFKLLLVNTGNTPWHKESNLDQKGYPTYQEMIIGEFMKANPNIQVNLIIRDVTQGSMTVDALMAKGTPPDVWLDAGGYFVKYLNASYALPMEKYMDISVYQESVIGPYMRDGHAYAVPSSNVATGMAVNLDHLAAVGYTLPPTKDWTTDEFARLSEKLKAAKIPATMIMTKQGLISWNLVWLYAFGAELYKNYDHGKVTINSPEAVKGLDYMKMLVDKGYAWPFPNEVDDDKGVDLFTTGKVTTLMCQNGHTDYWVPEQIKQGTLAKEFGLTFVEFPHATGREHTPVYGYQTAVLAHNSGNEAKNKAIAALFKTQVGEEYQIYSAANNGGLVCIKGLEPPNTGAAARASYKAISKLAGVAGLMDLGSMEPRAREIGDAWKLPIQAFMDGKLTAQQVLDQFEAAAAKILAQK